MTCAKNTVVAVIVNNGNVYVGSNWCKNPQIKCPRLKDENYEKCKTICKQHNHAEIDACLKAKENARGGTLYLIGHTYCCDNCVKVMRFYEIKQVFIILPGDVVKEQKIWQNNKIQILRRVFMKVKDFIEKLEQIGYSENTEIVFNKLNHDKDNTVTDYYCQKIYTMMPFTVSAIGIDIDREYK